MRADLPFVAQPVTDESAAHALADRLARDLGLPPPDLLKVGMNATYAAGPVVIRVGRVNAEPRAAYDLADALNAAEIRVPRPGPERPVAASGELVATVWERIVAAGEVDWERVGAMVARLRALDVHRSAPGYPIPAGTSYPWWQFDAMLERARPLLDAQSSRALEATIAEHGDWPVRAGDPAAWVLCHGDVHPANVIGGPGGPVILDWDLLCLGPPGWDHAPLRSMVARWGVDPAAYRDFAAGYGADLGDDPVTVSLTQLRLVAATLMRVIAEGPAREPDGEAERRLRHWRGDPAAPTWVMS